MEKVTYTDVHARLRTEDVNLLDKLEETYWTHIGNPGKPYRFRAQTMRFAFDLATRYLKKKNKDT